MAVYKEKMTENEKISLKGRISRVTTKFAFVNTDRGTIFCPLAASIPTTEDVPDMTTRYASGDPVFLTALFQKEKNGCKWRATKMRMMNEKKESNSQSCSDGPADVQKCIAKITRITETYVYCSYFGEQIFVPGAAFDSGEVTRLNSYLEPGDELDLVIRPQSRHNECKWIAISATKYVRHSETVFRGHGNVIEVRPDAAVISTETHGLILASILTWCGGDGGKNAVGLDEILGEGDLASYYAVVHEEGFRIVAWTVRGFYPCLNKVDHFSIGTQTAVSPSDMVVRAMKTLASPALLEEKPAIRLLLEMISDI